MKKIILLSGKMQSGKNASADVIFDYLNKNNKSYKHLFFAKKLKDACKEDFTLLKDYLNNFIGDMILKFTDSVDYELLQELSKLRLNDNNFYEEKTELSRILLQLYGTEIFRNRVGENYWVDKVVTEIRESNEEYFILTDVRFPNEIIHLIRSLNPLTHDVIKIRVNRNLDRSGYVDEHSSEIALDNFNEWDYVIENDSDLIGLQNKTLEIIKEI